MKSQLCLAATGLSLLLLSACGGDDGDANIAVTSAYVIPRDGVEIIEGVASANPLIPAITSTMALEGGVQPWNATNQDVTWSSDNTDVARVSAGGVVTARSLGTANITVVSDDGEFVSNACKVEVVPREPVADLKLWRVTATAANPTAPPVPMATTWEMAVGATLVVQTRVRSEVDEKIVVDEEEEPILDEWGDEVWVVVDPDDDEESYYLYDYLATYKNLVADFSHPACATLAMTTASHPYRYTLTAVSPGAGTLRFITRDGVITKTVNVTVLPRF